MATYTYPSNDLERANLLLSLLGSHWHQTYQGQHLVRGFVTARANEEAQAHLDLLETLDLFSRLDVPLFHTDNWYLLMLRESERDEVVLRYGDGAAYGDQFFYGRPTGARVYAYPLPDDLAAVTMLFNRLTGPSLSWTHGVDFLIDVERQQIFFREDPLESPLVSQRAVFSGTDITDQEAALWLFKGQFDWLHAYRQFGYVLGLRTAESKQGYTDLVNAVFDALTEGSTQKHIQLALAAMSGIPLVVEPVETVELIQTDRTYLVIVTDQHVYKYHASDTAAVSVGDTVYAGQCLTSAIVFYEFNRGEVPSALRFLTVDSGHVTGYVGGLTFRNEEVPLIVEPNVDGKTKISFELGGFPTDVELFWEDVHARGVAEGVSLGNLLDIRGPGAPSEPTAASLPPTVNALAFLVANILRNNAFAAVIRVSLSGSGALGFRNVDILRKVIPPWTCLFLIQELDVADTLTMDSAGDTTTPGYVEDVTSFPATENATDSLDGTSMLTEQVTIQAVDGFCE